MLASRLEAKMAAVKRRRVHQVSNVTSAAASLSISSYGLLAQISILRHSTIRDFLGQPSFDCVWGRDTGL